MSKTNFPKSHTDRTIGLIPSGTAVLWVAMTIIGVAQLRTRRSPPAVPTSKPDPVVLAIDVALNDPAPSVPDLAADQTPEVAQSDDSPPVMEMPAPSGPALMPIAPPPKVSRRKTDTAPHASAGPVFKSIDHGAVAGYMPDPVFPDDLARAGMQGTVVIDLIVDPDGTIVSAVYRVSSGWEALNISAIQQIEDTWKFPPGSRRYYEKSFTFKRVQGE